MRNSWSRGQEEAPMEILIAVALLTFVLVLGITVYQNMCKDQFEQKMKSSLNAFVTALESVYQGATGSSQPAFLDFTPEGCGSFDAVRLFEGTTELCQKQVGLNDCLVVATTIFGPGRREIVVTQATNIPRSIIVEYDNRSGKGIYGQSGQSWDKMDAQDWEAPAFYGAGSYTFQKVNSQTLLISKAVS